MILTGSPPGIGYFQDPKYSLKNGDVVEIEISSIGVLENTVVFEQPSVGRQGFVMKGTNYEKYTTTIIDPLNLVGGRPSLRGQRVGLEQQAFTEAWAHVLNE